MRLPKFPDKKPSKLQMIGFACLAISLLLYAVASWMDKTPQERPWAYDALPYSQEISLSQAMDILKEDPQGRRATAMGYVLLIEVVPGAGNAPKRLENDFIAREEARGEALKAAARTDKSVEEAADDTLPPL